MMVWGDVSVNGTIDLVGINGNIDSVYYWQVLQNCLMKEVGLNLGEDWILQQNDARHILLSTRINGYRTQTSM